MILSDRDIKDRIAKGNISIKPFEESCLQPASYDLHLDNEFKIYKSHLSVCIDCKEPVKDLMESVFVKDNEFFVLHPKSFALALVREITGVDSSHVGRLEGKSSLARLGLIIHTTAGFLDPGNELKLTLELYNASPLPLKLYPGMKIAQIDFEELSSKCLRPYNSPGLGSKYYGATSIQESMMYQNFKKK